MASPPGGTPRRGNAELDEFVRCRLLVTDTEHNNNDTVVIAVAHEAFLSEWEPLARTIEANRDTLRRRRAVEQAAAE